MKTMNFFAYSLMISGMMLTSCGSDDSSSGTDDDLPPIGGYNSADEVGEADLMAYWPLDGNGTESKSGVQPNASQGDSYSPSTKGQSLKLVNGYLGYPAISNLSTSMASTTVSLWAKINNNGTVDGYPTMMFQLSKPNDWAGNVNFMSETGWRSSTSDTLVIKGYVKIKTTDGGENGQDVVNSPNPSADDLAAGHTGNPAKFAGQWAHYVMTWDATNGMFMIYANGQKISNAKYESRNNGEPLALNFFTPTMPVIGTFAPVLNNTNDPWQKPMTGELDEIRVWKKALTQAEITALYELEKAGR